MSRNGDRLRQKKIVDAIVNDPANQTLTSVEVYEAKVRADRLVDEIYSVVLANEETRRLELLKQLTKEDQ